MLYKIDKIGSLISDMRLCSDIILATWLLDLRPTTFTNWPGVTDLLRISHVTACIQFQTLVPSVRDCTYWTKVEIQPSFAATIRLPGTALVL